MPNRPQARQAGFTIVEVMVAAIVLVVGFMGMVDAVGVSSAMMDNARRQTLAGQILSQEIEQMRFSSWSTISGLPTVSTSVSIDPQFASAIAATGATYSVSRILTDPDPATDLREVEFTVTWVVKTSRHDSGGNLLTFTYSRSQWAYFGKYGLNLTYQRS